MDRLTYSSSKLVKYKESIKLIAKKWPISYPNTFFSSTKLCFPGF